MEQNFQNILQQNQLKVTATRLSVLELIASRNAATSQPYLEKNINKEIDRVTLYRTLRTFEEKGILHKVIDLNGTANYAMCSDNCTAGHHHDEHFHFNCTQCHQLYCMNDFHFPPFQMPAGFKSQSINLLISGTCAQCNKMDN
ncbi:Fur family transcriptional regulator [Mucilaginibacter sp.]